MKIGSELQYECPDKCPKDCEFEDDFINYGQNAICGRCPVFLCKEPENIEDSNYMPMVPANHVRDDWAKEWDEFFKTGKEPVLKLHYKEESDGRI